MTALLLPYQARLWRLLKENRVVVCEKSRRIGMSWAAAAYGVLQASRSTGMNGCDVLYVGYNLSMAQEFLAAAQGWVEAFEASGVSLGCTLATGSRMMFQSGYGIKALSSRPRSLRGRQGLVIIDEAAFHDQLDDLLKAALALLIWQGKLLVISTHYGRHNAFYKLIEQVKAGALPYSHLRVTFDDALNDGLFRRIARVTGQRYSQAGQRVWEKRIRTEYGEAAAEELDCIAGNHSGAYFPRNLLEGCCKAKASVLRYHHTGDEDFAFSGGIDVLNEALTPVLEALADDHAFVVGVDFGRHHDLSVFTVIEASGARTLSTPLTVELAATPFADQWQVLKRLLEGLPRLMRVVMDRGGIGAWLHEQAELEFGRNQVEGVQISRGWYADVMPRLKAALEQGQLLIADDEPLREDLGQIAVIDNIPRPYRRRAGRHADGAIALALAYQAASEMACRNPCVAGDSIVGGSARLMNDQWMH